MTQFGALSRRLLVVLSASLVVVGAAPALADDAPISRTHLAYESGSVAAGAAITSPVLNTKVLNRLTVALANGGGGSSRVIQVNCLAQDGVSVLFALPAVTVVAGASGLLQIGPFSTQATAPAGVTLVDVDLCASMQVSVAAAGAAAAQLAVYGR